MSRTLLIDVREACRAVRAGKAQWTYGFVTELRTRGVPLTLLTDEAAPSEWEGTETIVLPQTGFAWHRAAAAFARERKNEAVYVSPTSYLVPWMLGKSMRCVPVVHDLIAFRREPHQRRAQMIERLTLYRAAHAASRILTISDSTRDDLLRRYPRLHPEHIRSIFAGPMRPSAPLSEPDGRSILCIATLCPRKNQERLIRAYATLPADLRGRYRLELVGSRGWQDEEIMRLVESTSGVRWRDHVPDAEYERLLHTCTIFALPSLYEGFGMQILDALQRGIPVLTSDRGSLAEVTADAACVVNPESVESIASGLLTMLQSDEFLRSLRHRGPLRAARYSWKKTVDTALEVLQPLL